jgi:hypothetical protein
MFKHVPEHLHIYSLLGKVAKQVLAPQVCYSHIRISQEYFCILDQGANCHVVDPEW